MTAKTLIKDFYKSDALMNGTTMESFLHDDFILEWQSSKGFFKRNKKEVIDFSEELRISYADLKIKIHSLVADKNEVAVRYSHFVKTVENPREEMLLAHFFVFWEVKDEKLYRCYQMSQIA